MAPTSIMNSTSTPIKPGRLMHLIEELIDVYSPSGKEEEVVEFLFDYLSRHNLPVVRQEVDENRHNLIVLPPGGVASMAFIGHVDTVSAFDLENYGPRHEGDLLFGLGAADMKGGCAAMIEAYISLWENSSSPGPVALALVVGEEETGDGAAALKDHYAFPCAIIGEPTDMEPCLSQYGYIEMRLQIHGHSRHASLARPELSPVEGMFRILLRLTEDLEHIHPELVYNIRDLFSTSVGFVVPHSCESWLDIHLPPAMDILRISDVIESLIEREKNVFSELTIGVSFTTMEAGYELSKSEPMTELIRSVYEERGMVWRPSAFQSHSDANQLWSAGIKPVVLGPGSLELAHRPDEAVSISRVIEAAEIYYQIAVKAGGETVATI